MQSGFRTSQYEELLVQVRMVRKPVPADVGDEEGRRPDSTSVVHGPRAPCEGSWRAVHLVVLVEMLQETLFDGVRVDDEEVAHRSIKPVAAGREVARADRL